MLFYITALVLFFPIGRYLKRKFNWSGWIAYPAGGCIGYLVGVVGWGAVLFWALLGPSVPRAIEREWQWWMSTSTPMLHPTFTPPKPTVDLYKKMTDAAIPTKSINENLAVSVLEVIRNLDNPEFIATKYKNYIRVEVQGSTLRFVLDTDAESVEELTDLAAELLYYGATVAADPQWVINRVEFVNPGPQESYVLFDVDGHDTLLDVANDTTSIWDVMQVYVDWGKATPPTPSIEHHCLYIVQPGDTLSKIGRKFSVSWQEVQALNNLPDPNRIKPGDELLIPVPC